MTDDETTEELARRASCGDATSFEPLVAAFRPRVEAFVESRLGPGVWKPARDGRRGGQLKFSGPAIETALILRLVFHLPLRQTEGFLASLSG